MKYQNAQTTALRWTEFLQNRSHIRQTSNLKIKYVPYTSVKKWSVMLLYICSLFENNPSSSDLESIFLKRCIDQEKAMLQIWYHPELSIRAIQVYGKIWVVEWGHNICDLSKKKKMGPRYKALKLRFKVMRSRYKANETTHKVQTNACLTPADWW